MYNPYVKRGEWIDCTVCGSAHRRILPNEVESYVTADGNPLTLSDAQSTQCYKCQPLQLHEKFHCTECGEDSIVPKVFGESSTTICPKCNHDNAPTFTSNGVVFTEALPKMDSDMKYVLNRIKKNHYNSTMPDY